MKNDFYIEHSPPPPFGGFGKRYEGNYVGHDFVPVRNQSVVDNNVALFKEIAQESKVEAVKGWLNSVSGGWFNFEIDHAVPDADYITHFDPTLSFSQSEDLGNFNYATTGYSIFMDILTDIGISEDMADTLVRPILRAGGGVYQVVMDLNPNFYKTGKLFKRKIDRNKYGEEVRDVPVIEAGMDYMRKKRLIDRLKRADPMFDTSFLDIDITEQKKSTLESNIDFEEYHNFIEKNKKAMGAWENDKIQRKKTASDHERNKHLPPKSSSGSDDDSIPLLLP